MQPISQGHYAQAETMMREVAAAKPGSAKAHYIYAEILAHERRFDLAAEEAASAKRLDPQLKFTQPEKFNTFSQLLEREQANARRVSTPERSAAPAQARRESLELPANNGGGGGMPGWVWGLGGAGLAFIAWRMFSASQQTGSAGALTPAGAGGMRAMPMGSGQPSNNGYAPAPAPAATPGTAPGYGQPAYAPQAAAPSSGLLGTGLAVAGGLAAGMMVEKLFEGHRETSAGAFGNSGGFGGMGGNNAAPNLRDTSPGLFETQTDSAAQELEQRPIDMGTGDDWDSGNSAASDDGGGSSGGSDDW
ncbi:tetratricopeptide repeat protein [Roseateles sp. GG27B]